MSNPHPRTANPSRRRRQKYQSTPVDVRLQPFERVEWINTTALVPDPDNPKIHDDHQLHVLAQAIMASTVMTPIIIDSKNRILAGHARLEAAKLLMLPQVPALRVEGLSEAEFRLYQLADNRVGELGRWDDRLLTINLKALADLKPNFSLEAAGWRMPELDIKFAGLNGDPATDENGVDLADLIPPREIIAASRAGYIWLCGDHRVACGNCLDTASMIALMRGELARMGFQDPPYNVSVTKHVGGLGKIKHREFAMATGEMSRGGFAEFLKEEISATSGHCVPGAVVMVFMDWRSIDLLIAAGRGLGFELLNICVWNKGNASLGSLYRSKHELIAVFKKPGAAHINNIQLSRFGRHRSNVWDAPGANSFGKNRMTELGAHPTPKNVDLISEAIRDVTHSGDIVLDSFLGSGTTMIAAERSGRIAYGMEIDPIYVDVAVRRWEQFTGRAATLEGDGRSFAEIARAEANAANA